MEAGREHGSGKVFAQLDLFAHDSAVPKHEIWLLRCDDCPRYRMRGIGVYHAGHVARKHANKYGHTVTGQVFGSSRTKLFPPDVVTEDVDKDAPPY